MEKSEHTPGPWAVNLESANRVTGPDNVTVAAVYGGTVGDTVQLANCRLIALAPTMYAYIVGKAGHGDDEARELIASLESDNA